MGRLLHLVQRGGAWVGCGPAQSHPRCTKMWQPNVTAHPSTASVPTSYYSMWHYNYFCTLKTLNDIVLNYSIGLRGGQVDMPRAHLVNRLQHTGTSVVLNRFLIIQRYNWKWGTVLKYWWKKTRKIKTMAYTGIFSVISVAKIVVNGQF